MKTKRHPIAFAALPVLLVFVLLSGPPAHAKEAPRDNTPVRFVVLGDRTGGHVPGAYEQTVAEVVRMRPDFVITVGDHVEGYTEDTVRMAAEWQEYDAIVAPLTNLYLTPGNHDITTDPCEPWYRSHVGKPYYSFDHKNLHIIVLDVSRCDSSRQLPADQMNWLIGDLKNTSKAGYTMVFFHKPFWWNSIAEGKPDTLHTLFVKYGVDAVFTGHFHEYFHGEYDGILYTSIGSSGAETTPDPSGLLYHFAWVTVDSQGIHIAPIKQGAVLPVDQMTVGDRKTIQPIQMFGITFANTAPVDPVSLTVGRDTVSVVLNNTLSDQELDDTLRWSVPEGWTVTPPVLAVKVAPRSNRTFEFEVAGGAKLYPVPRATVNFTYAPGKKVSSENYLRVQRQVNCYPVTAPPVIDGQITEEFWRDPVTRFFDENGKPDPAEPAQFYFAYDKDNLYLAAYCQESKMDSVRAKATEHDGGIFGEDCVGYFLEPRLGTDTVYQIYFNPLGTSFDQKISVGSEGYASGDRRWNGTYVVKSARGENFWSVEAQIPLAQWGATAEKDQEWRLNFRRKQPRLTTAADWQIPIDYNANTYGLLRMK